MNTATVLMLLALAYLIARAYWPYKACRACRGTGRRSSPTGKAWRSCSRCGGSGRRAR